MTKTTMLCAAMACAMVAESSEAPSLMTPAHDGKSFKVPWQDESVSSINRLPARSAVRPCSKDGCEYVLSLDGEWDFEWKNGDERRKGKINVPGCWQLQGEYDPPQYTNMTYPFAFDPPNVESEPPAWWTSHRFRNPHGIYRRSFQVPAEWRGRDVTLRLNGYSSAAFVRLNGRDVGYGEDGRLPSEWNLAPYLVEGDNALEVEVLKFSDEGFGFNVWPWTQKDLKRARHVEDLVEDPEWLTVNIDCAMTGVGGDDAWGARPHAAYLLKGAKTYVLKFTISEWGVPCRGQIVYN